MWAGPLITPLTCESEDTCEDSGRDSGLEAEQEQRWRPLAAGLRLSSVVTGADADGQSGGAAQGRTDAVGNHHPQDVDTPVLLQEAAASRQDGGRVVWRPRDETSVKGSSSDEDGEDGTYLGCL